MKSLCSAIYKIKVHMPKKKTGIIELCLPLDRGIVLHFNHWIPSTWYSFLTFVIGTMAIENQTGENLIDRLTDQRARLYSLYQCLNSVLVYRVTLHRARKLSFVGFELRYAVDECQIYLPLFSAQIYVLFCDIYYVETNKQLIFRGENFTWLTSYFADRIKRLSNCNWMPNLNCRQRVELTWQNFRKHNNYHILVFTYLVLDFMVNSANNICFHIQCKVRDIN